MRSLFVELQSLWIEQGFSTADLIADDRAWELMGAIAKLLPRKDNPAVTGFDLELLQTDLLQLEQLFLTGDRGGIYAYRADSTLFINLTIDDFRGCKILEFCRFEPRMVLQDGHAAWLERKDAAAEPGQTEEPPPVAEVSEPRQRRKPAAAA